MEKEVTIYDLAELLKISPATVSRGLQDHPAISKKTKKRIFDLAEQIGYRTNSFARNLRSRQSNTLGVIVQRLDSNFISTVIAGMEDTAASQGYQLIICQSSEQVQKEKSNAKALLESRVDGLMVSLAFDTEDLSHFNAFFQKKIPLIFFDRVMDHPGCTQVLIDNRKAACEATRHLVEQGCKRIVHVTAPLKQNVYVERLEGYKQALADAGLPFREEYVLLGNLRQEDGRAAAAAIVQMNPAPDGVFFSNDNCAAACVVALKAAGFRVPEDIAVVGFNNDPVATVVEPNLTTVDYPGYEMGKTAARILIRQLETGEAYNSHTTVITLPSELVIRQSSLHTGVAAQT
jgi:LacI family transcriptional regulator